MRILFVTNQFPSKKFPYKGSFIFNQAKEIQEKKNEVIILSPNYGNDIKLQHYDGLKNYRFQTFTRSTSDPLLRNLFRGINGFFAMLLFIVIQTINIIRISNKEKIDVIHAHWILPSGFSSYLASKITKKKLIITAYGSDLTFCGQNNLLRKIICFITLQIPVLICISDKLKIIANQLCRKKVNVETILIGISEKIYSNHDFVKKNNVQEIKNRYKLIMVASLYPLKGIQYLLESMRILSKRKQNFLLEIIGDGENISLYKEYIKNNNLEKYVKFCGFKPHDKTLAMIEDADIAIQASLSEGMSVYIQESVSLGKAIIATNVGGTNEIVIEEINGYLIEPENSQQLAEKIEYLLSNPEKIKKFGDNSLKIAQEKLSLEQNMGRVVKIYRRLLKT